MKVQTLIRKGARKLSEFSSVNKYKFHVPPGHFYSPLISEDLIKRYENAIFSTPNKEIAGINLYEEGQLALLNSFLPYYKKIPFQAEKQDLRRYYFNNEYYSYSDAIFLHFMILHNKPKKIIEVGSGFSSALMLDTNQLFFSNSIELTFIEPYPERLRAILKSEDNISLHQKFLQDVDLSLFSTLQENDILFVDSSHVVKTGSDVNYLLFNILPFLNRGVIIHFHDVFFPFEYPKEWILKFRRCWNEDYFLRAFLMYNNQFKITLFNSFLEQFHREWLEKNMPLCLKDTGASLWLTKI